MRPEFIIGEREQVDHFAKKSRWRACERASWLKPDGTVIHYLRFPETVADLEPGSIVHILGVDAIIGLPPRIASRLSADRNVLIMSNSWLKVWWRPRLHSYESSFLGETQSPSGSSELR